MTSTNKINTIKMQEDTPIFLEDSRDMPRDKIMLQIAECLKKLHAAGSSNLDMKKASNQLQIFFKRRDSIEIFLQVVVQSTSEKLSMAASNYLRGELRTRLMLAKTLDLQMLGHYEKLLISAILDYSLPSVVEETLAMLIGDIYRTNACKNFL